MQAPLNSVDVTEFVLAHQVDFVLRGDVAMLAPLVVLSTDMVVDDVLTLFFSEMVNIKDAVKAARNNLKIPNRTPNTWLPFGTLIFCTYWIACTINKSMESQ